MISEDGKKITVTIDIENPSNLPEAERALLKTIAFYVTKLKDAEEQVEKLKKTVIKMSKNQWVTAKK
jgi:hypothetical protein